MLPIPLVVLAVDDIQVMGLYRGEESVVDRWQTPDFGRERAPLRGDQVDRRKQ
jgi:hypothetical protein